MKLLILVLTSVLASQSVLAANYICTDSEGHEAQLTTLANNRIQWVESWHSASSRGSFVGKETAPYSEYNGFAKYQLEDFYLTEDSSYMLALGRKGKTRTAVVYFDNDDHVEEETIYSCELVN